MSDAVAQAGTVSYSSGSTLVPSKIADTRRSVSAGSPSTSCAINSRRRPAPWEWPINTNGRPSLSLAKKCLKDSATSSYAMVRVLSSDSTWPSNAVKVRCLYVGANTRHDAPSRAAWFSVVEISSFSAGIRSLLAPGSPLTVGYT